MNRRRFLTLGLATAAMTTLSGCSPRAFCGLGGNASCGSVRSRIYYSHNQYTTVKLFQHGKNFLLLSPDFHLVGTYQPDEFFMGSGKPQKTVPLSEVPFANLPDSLLKRAYIKYGSDSNQVFRVRSNSTETVFGFSIAWLKSELNPAESKRLDDVIAVYNAQLDKLDLPSYTRSLNPPPLRNGSLYFAIPNSYYTNYSRSLLPILRDGSTPAYTLYTRIEGELYAPSTFPAGFFDDGAKNVAYNPVSEAPDSQPTDSLTKTYAWQSRPSPVKINANGQVTLNGRVFKPLSLRSVLQDKDDEV